MRCASVALIVVATGCFATKTKTADECARDGQAIIDADCKNCHSTSRIGAARALAPEGIDFDTTDELLRWRDRIVVRAVEQGTMPPGVALSTCDREALSAFLDALPEPPAPCIADCEGRACGSDGCEGSCGTCNAAFDCNGGGQCVCAPQCSGRVCGADGCGGECGTCAANERCDLDGTCHCVPSCTGKQCGDDGCGGSCGMCPSGDVCNAGACECAPDCTGKQCGNDGCDGSCGMCTGMRVCNTRQGQCVMNCTPDCTGRACGDDGCGGSCGMGTCPTGQSCTASGQCVCEPSCVGRACGDDGCGGSCGACASDTSCSPDGQCTCTPDCTGRICGDDGCGGSCGTCPMGACNASGTTCQCVPSCPPGSCGDDGCNGSCGGCATGQTCSNSTCVWPSASFANDVMPIFSATCGGMGCHAGMRPAADLDLSSAQVAYSDLIGVPSTQCANKSLVVAGDPGASYLINKLTGVGMCMGSIMPKTGPALTVAQIDAVRAWLGNGAPNN